MKAIIADDHPLFRGALKQAVQSVIDGEIYEAENFEQTMSLLEEYPEIDVVFLDLNMPGNEGFTGLSAIRNAYPSIQAVMVSAEENPTIIRKALDFGASGYIPKSSDLNDIADAISVILDGELWLPEGVKEKVEGIQNEEGQAFAKKLDQLTPHQFRVLKLVADGLLNKQIAYELDVQETTIKQHMSAILKKLGVFNRTQAGIIFKQVMEFEPLDS
ncbi:response regulator transcription factor [Alteromonadaceae bacterium M269]|nr:response regulator transcription factor [Alteromonadaceae bacterium M269]